jgi:hypothetical protein
MGKKKKVEPFYDLPIQHCLQPATTSTSPGCKGFEGCSCNCDPCNGRRWEAVRPDPDLSVLPVPADVVPPVEAWAKRSELVAKLEEVEGRIKELEGRLQDLEREQVSPRAFRDLESSLERRIGNVENDAHSLRRDVDALERGAR